MTDPRHRVAVALAAFALVVMTLDVREPTFEEAMAQGTWEEGDVTIRGIVDEAHVVSTAQGPIHTVSLRYAWYDWPFVALTNWLGPGTVGGLSEYGDLRVDGALDEGTNLHMDLQFEAFQLDGTPVIAPREATCLHPCLHMAIADVLDSVSEVQGLELQLESSADWVTYQVHESDSPLYAGEPLRVPLEDVHARLVSVVREEPIAMDAAMEGLGRWDHEESATASLPIDSLHDWRVLASVDFVFLAELTGPNDAGGPLVPLADASEWLLVDDVDGDRHLGEGDRIRVHVSQPSGSDQSTHVLQVMSCSSLVDSACGVATKMVVMDADGPLEWDAPQGSPFIAP